MSLDLIDLQSRIKDSVSAALAEKATTALEVAVEDVKKAKAEGRDLLGELRAKESSAIPSKDTRGLDFARALKAQAVAKMTGREARDVANEWGKRSGSRHYAAIADQLAQVREARAMGEGTFSAGGSLVPSPAMGEFIDLTYAKTLAIELGANVIDINRALDLGKMTAGATAYYVEELGNITPSQPTTGKVSLSAKKVAAVVPISNELLRNPSAGADRIVRDNLVRTIANRRDLSFYRGTGSAGQPRGMLYWRNSANTDTQGGTTVADKVADTIQLIRMVDESNVGLDAAAAFVMAPRVKWALAATYDSGVGLVFASMLNSGTLWGFPVGSTTAIPKNLGGGGNESEIHFGLHADTIIGIDENTPPEVELFVNGTYHDGSNLVSGISADASVFRILEGHDVVLQHDLAWATLTAITWA